MLNSLIADLLDLHLYPVAFVECQVSRDVNLTLYQP